MGDFKKRSGGFGSRDGGRGRSNGRSDFRRGGRDNERQEMHKAVCASCNKTCEIPFKPSNDRPVYCSDCFRTNKDSGYSDGGRRDNDFKSSQQRFPKNSAAFTAPKTSNTDTKQLKELKYQLETVNKRLERIIDLMGGNGDKKDDTLKDVVEKAVASDKKPKKKTTKKETKGKDKKTTKKVKKKTTNAKKPKKK